MSERHKIETLTQGAASLSDIGAEGERIDTLRAHAADFAEGYSAEDKIKQLKRSAAYLAASYVEDGMIVGLGTGSTAAFMVEALGERWKQGLRFKGIPTSEKTAEQARSLGLELTGFAQHPVVDIAIDGADEVQRGGLNLVKGLGGALLREKIVAESAKRFIVIVDESKVVDHLGSHAPVPVETVLFGWERAAFHLAELGATPKPRVTREGQVFITDGGNMILDCHFPPIEDPAFLARQVEHIVGVVESGLFIGMTSEVLVAHQTGIEHLTA